MPDTRDMRMAAPRWLLLVVAGMVTLGFASAARGAAEEEIVQSECEDIGEKGFGLCLGFTGFAIDGGGETLLPYGERDSHAVVRARRFTELMGGYFDLHLEYQGGSSYNLDTHWYGATAQVILRSESFVRNLEHRELPLASDNTGSPLYTPDDRDPGADYELDINDTSLYFKKRLKNYPAHASVTVRRYETEGEIQQLLLNENCTTNCHNVSQTRTVQTTTDQVTLTGDAHVGLVDVSYRLKRTQFADDRSAPVFSYDPIPGLRPVGGPAEHNVYPDITATEHYLDVSTNPTGRYTGYLGLGLGERENDTSGVREEYSNLAGRFSWRPNEKVAVTLRSGRLYRQDSEPGSALGTLRVANGMPTEYGTLETRHEATVHYYASRAVNLTGKVRLAETTREDNEDWNLPDRTTSDRWLVGGRLRLGSGIKLKASYTTENTEDPAYATGATDSRRTQLGGSWAPTPGFCMTADLKDLQEDNDDNGRRSERRLINAGVLYVPAPRLSLSLSYYTFEDEVDADLTFDGPVLVVDEAVPYRASGDQYVVTVTWNASDNVEITGGVAYLDAKGAFTAAADPFADVGDYSPLKAVQQESTLEVGYSISPAWDLTTRIAVLSYEDRTGATEDETVNELTALVTRRW